MAGGGGAPAGGVVVYVNVSGDGTSSETNNSQYEGFGKDIGTFVDNRYKTLVERDLRAGGALNRAIREGG
jgi:hypothetical protein